MPTPHLYIHTPVPIFKARVNMATINYPISQIFYDGVTLGSYTDVEFDAMLTLGTSEGADDLGRVRVRDGSTGTIIRVARSGQGIEDGLLDVADNAYITVWDDYRVWAKIPYFDLEDGIDYKDGDIENLEYTDDKIPPVSNCGPGFAGYIDELTEVITVEFPRDGVNASFALAPDPGADIATYNWDVGDGTITVGTSASAVITATFPAGFRWVSLTVVDTEGSAHTSRCPVLAVDPDDDVTYKHFTASQRLEKGGQTLSLEIFDTLDRDTFLDGTLVMFWLGEAATPDDRDHMKFIGWLDSEQHRVNRSRTGLDKGVALECLDVAGKLRNLPGFPQALSRVDTESPWSYMPTLNINRSLHYLLHWHSTALSLADFVLPGDGDDYTAMRLDASGADLFSQVDSQAQKMVPDHYLTCNTGGQLVVRRDWRLDDVGDRPAASHTVNVNEWNNLRWEYSRHPKVHVLRSGAILASTAFDENGEIPLVFSVAPSDSMAFGQGTQEVVENEGLAVSQDELNIAEGHRFAMLNSRYGSFTWDDPTGEEFWNYEPAAMFRVELEMSALVATQRGLPFTDAYGMVESINAQYVTSKFGTHIKATAVWKKEEEGGPAITHVPEEAEDIDYTPPVATIPDLDDEIVFGGNITGYIAWDGAHVVRTMDLQTASPSWEEITNEVTGDIYDLQYFMVDPDTVGVWLLGSAGIWVCLDIMAVTPSWDNVLPTATIVAGDEVPPAGSSRAQSMAHYWLQPGHLCVATGPNFTAGAGSNYLHAYFWVTEDYGQTWTQVDMNDFTFTSSGDTRCYAQSGLHGMACFRSDPTIWCVRGTDRTGVATGDTAVFKSADGGYTWSKEHSFGNWSRGEGAASIHHPYPSIDDPSYIVRQTGNTSTNPFRLWVSTDAWATATEITTLPASHDGGFILRSNLGCQRINKRTFDNAHILNILSLDSSSFGDLYESEDNGANWTLLETLASHVVVPNGWPPDVDQWVMIDAAANIGQHITLTLDNFATLLDRDGDIETVIGEGFSVHNGSVGGFALPKVGINAD